MSEREVLFIGDSTGLVQCVDPAIGTIIMSYSGIASVAKNTLALLAKDYLIAANNGTPCLKIWPLNSQTGNQFAIGGQATALASSKDGVHSAIAIDAKIYVYQNNSGLLLGVLTKHIRGITKILFLDDSIHFVTCDKTGEVFVWNLGTAVTIGNSSLVESGVNEPLYSFSHHSLAVTDAYVGPGALKGRLYTAGLDHCVNMYGLRDGTHLLLVTFEVSLTSLRPNSIETAVFLGTSNGKILEFALNPLPRTLNHQAQDTDLEKSLDGHNAAVTCLQLSMGGQTLVSGGDDNIVRVWDLPSRQVLRVFNVKGPVSSVIFSLALENIFTDDLIPTFAYQPFQRVSCDELQVTVMVKEKLKPIDYSELLQKKSVPQNKISGELRDLKMQHANALRKNKELFRFAMEKILRSPYNSGNDESSFC